MSERLTAAPNVHASFDEVYADILTALVQGGEQTVNRKAETLTELHDYKFTVTDPLLPLALRRNLSTKYLEGEFKWYLSGSLLLSDAVKLSKFWKRCSDDGNTVNSNYGYLIFHRKNTHGLSQFEHALRCLQNNPRSKKAVIQLYGPDHGYMSNDNPCTMFLRLWIDKDTKLNISVFMRSSDVYFGLPYDVPWFCFVLYSAWRILSLQYTALQLGTYTHVASSLHAYSRNKDELAQALNMPYLHPEELEQQTAYMMDLYAKSYDTLAEIPFQDTWGVHGAWTASHESKCKKKKVGCFILDEGGHPLSSGFGGRNADTPCETCVRESGEEDQWFGDECPSVHSEMRAVLRAMKDGHAECLTRSTVYVTHGPCDACLKLLDYIGVKDVVFDKPYKTHYDHWPRIRVRRALRYYEDEYERKCPK